MENEIIKSFIKYGSRLNAILMYAMGASILERPKEKASGL